MKKEHYDFIEKNLGIPQQTVEKSINTKHNVLHHIIGTLTTMLHGDSAEAASEVIQTIAEEVNHDGGPGSGNWGHKGRPGEVGGSAEGNGTEETDYQSPEGKKKLAEPHDVSKKELNEIPNKSLVIVAPESIWEKGKLGNSYIYTCRNTGEVLTEDEMYNYVKEAASPEGVKIATPKSAKGSSENKSSDKNEKLADHLKDYHKITTKELNEVPDGTILKFEDDGLRLIKKTLDDGSVGYYDKESPDFFMSPDEIYEDASFGNWYGKFSEDNSKKFKKEWIKHHTPEKGELKEYPEGSNVYFEGDFYKKQNDGSFINDFDNEKLSNDDFEKKIADSHSKIVVYPPEKNSENENEEESKPKSNKRSEESRPITSFNAKAYTQERKENAFITHDIQTAHDEFNDIAKKVWNESSDDVHSALKYYTGDGFEDINERLRKKNYSEDRAELYNEITDTISKCRIPVDTFFQRGLHKRSFSKFLNIDSDDIDEIFETHDCSSLIGTTGSDDAFLSVGSCLGKGITMRPVQLEIFAPKGTQAMYIEPISQYGINGDNYDYDSPSGGNEFETLLQRCTKFVVSDAVFHLDTLYVQCEIVNQDYDRLVSQ